jgi:hypothetical protein
MVSTSEFLALLQKGVGPWNRWRQTNPFVIPLLADANLTGRDL